ncbi:DNA polymerase III subunit gamma and tau [Terrabacter sp. MAHUQ-38]|uniref:DNA polymerase III subunit gamma and tau n=1 Tax=unclassified Terrabacter TaxID=2630222 RepID=UPI00165D9115|nr:DNA polymerase III subunit gamma and tau [Terrabacter sp. MAHUQ-38]MBC9822579.1 DNA polymerase III subunit gamma and tau [Terrabacter sp. MAHUQ-38]
MATALYRRYRPESFADVIGQEHVTEPLMQALRTGRVNHAYLFSGPRGCGKTTSARILARCLNCEQGPTPIPCGTCDSCVALARGGSGSVDVIEIDAASHGGVDDARDLRERASYGPAQSRFKIYIIDEAHMVTPQGFNALLKIVEEPPEHVKFVFATTEPEKVIGTIRSRTHHYPFRLVPPAKLSAYMERLLEAESVPVQPGVLSFVTRAGGGSVRDSLSVLDQLIAGSGPDGLTYDGAVSLLGFTDGELLDSTVDALAAGDGAATFRQIDKVIESGHDPRRFIEDLLERLRDLIIVAAIPEGVSQVLRGVPEDQLERMRVQQAAFGPGALSRAADIVNTGLTEMTGATAPRLQLELICARILLPAASGEQGYAARLDRLERRLDVGGVPSAAGASTPLSSPPRPPSTPASPPTGPLASGVAAPPRTVSDYTPPAGGAASGASHSAGGMGGGGRSGLQEAVGAQTGPGDEGRVDAVRAEVGAPPVMTPDESVGGPSVADASHTRADHHLTGASTALHAEGVQAGAASADTDVSQGGGAPESAGSVPAAAPAGGMDTDAIRRAWPNVLGRIFTMRRITWTFVSQNAQVTAFDGKTLTLGIATAGLTQTFRAGNHADIVRQALIDELGVDAVVDGIHVDAVSQQAPVAPPPGAVPQGSPDGPGDVGGARGPGGPGSSGGGPGGASGGASGGGPGDPRPDASQSFSGGPDRPSWGDPGAGHESARAPGGDDSPAAGGSGSGSGSRGVVQGAAGQTSRGTSALADAGLSPVSGRSLESNAGWGSATGPAPDWATGPDPGGSGSAAASPASHPQGASGAGPSAGGGSGGGESGAPAPTASALRGASAVRESFAQARSRSSASRTSDEEQPRPPLTDDSAVSDDDEDIEQSGDVGRTVIEKVLGGRVVQELDD